MTPTALHSNYEADDFIADMQQKLERLERERDRLWRALERYRGQLDVEGESSAGRVLLILSGDMDREERAG